MNKQQPSPKARLLQEVRSYQNWGILLALACILVIAGVFTPSMFSFSSITTMLKNNAIYGIVAIGVMFVLLTGGFDLSTGAILSLSGNLIAVLQRRFDLPVVVWILAALLVGALCGLFNGFLVGELRIVSMLATLGSQYIFLGISYLIHHQLVLPHEFKPSFTSLAGGSFLSISNLVWILVLVYILVWLFQSYLKPGRNIYAVGNNAESARMAGIKESSTKLLAYTLCGMFCGLAGLLYVSTYSVGQYNMASDFAMKAISICVLGGVSPSGGKGRIDGMVISVLIISLIYYFASLLPGMSVWQDAVQGAIVIVALLINVSADRMAHKRDLRERGAAL